MRPNSPVAKLIILQKSYSEKGRVAVIKRKILTIMYANGITVHCLKVKRISSEWYWFIDRGDLVIEDAVKLQKAGAKNLKAANDTIIEVTAANNAYYSGDDTDKEIFGNYTIEGLYSAMLQNKQLKKVVIK